MRETGKKLIEDFEEIVREHENQLFGISLFNEAVKHLYKDDKNILETTENHFQQIISRGIEAIQEAKQVLGKVKEGVWEVKRLACIEFPPIHGPGLDEMTERASILVKTYDKLFPDRPHELTLTEEEIELLVAESAEHWQ
jgi:hypothetical protein